MKTYNIWGKFTVDVDFNIEANNEKEAEKMAKKMIEDQYSFDAIGGLHVAKSTDYKLYIDEDDE